MRTRILLALAALGFLAAGPMRGQSTEAAVTLLTDVRTLASDGWSGRLTGSPGADSAARYLARRFRQVGLKPGPQGFFQVFTIAREAPAAVHAGIGGAVARNVVGVLPGRDPELRNEIVVVGAHYDKASKGCGAVDNWTGIVILAHLYRTMRVSAPSKTILFVAFGREEDGLVGSRAMVNAIDKKDRDSYCSMVNLDSFGFARPQVLENVSTPKLTAFAEEVAKQNNVPFASAAVDAGADSTSFRDKGIPAVTLHGLSNTGLALIHTASDQVDRVNAGTVHIGYRFALMLIARLDQCDCKAFR